MTRALRPRPSREASAPARPARIHLTLTRDEVDVFGLVESDFVRMTWSDDASRCEVAVYPRTARALGCEGIRFAGAGRVPEEEAQRIAAVARLFCRAAGCEGSPR